MQASNFVKIWTMLSISSIAVVGQNVLGPYKRLLDPETGYILEWLVNTNDNIIIFNITLRLTIGRSNVFGLARKERLEGADVVSFGVDQDGSWYIHDMNGFTNSTLKYDVHQNWKLISTKRLPNKRALVSISRNLDTCDVKEDMIIGQDLVYVIWGKLRNENFRQGYEEEDIRPIPFTPLGSMPVYFLDMELPPINSDLQTWRFSRKLNIPTRHTSYWCSIQKAPKLLRKSHIVEFGAYFKDKQSEQHVHHQVAYRCKAPPGLDPVLLFEPFVNHPGQECYLNEGATPPFPILPFCREVIYLWGVGGYNGRLPDNIGFPLGEDSNEYYMLETHYDNPEVRSDLVVEAGVDFQYTPKIRGKDGGMFFIGYGVVTDVSKSGMVYAIPPHSTDFIIAGQCSPQCTREVVPKTGIQIFAVTLHAHIAARKMRLRHFRGNKELPLIQSDEYYDFNFQQMRLLPKPVTILPGDHVVAECVYATSWKNGSTVSGFATRDEMCNAFIYSEQRVPYMYCSSEYSSDSLLTRFGVSNFTWDLDSSERIVTASSISPNHVGLRFSQVVDLISYNWTPAQRRNFQIEMLYSDHVASCPSIENLARSALPTAASSIQAISSSSVFYPRNATPQNLQPSRCYRSLSSTLGEGRNNNFLNSQLHDVPYFYHNSSPPKLQSSTGSLSSKSTRVEQQQNQYSHPNLPVKSFQHQQRIW